MKCKRRILEEINNGLNDIRKCENALITFPLPYRQGYAWESDTREHFEANNIAEKLNIGHKMEVLAKQQAFIILTDDQNVFVYTP